MVLGRNLLRTGHSGSEKDSADHPGHVPELSDHNALTGGTTAQTLVWSSPVHENAQQNAEIDWGPLVPCPAPP